MDRYSSVSAGDKGCIDQRLDAHPRMVPCRFLSHHAFIFSHNLWEIYHTLIYCTEIESHEFEPRRKHRAFFSKDTNYCRERLIAWVSRIRRESTREESAELFSR